MKKKRSTPPSPPVRTIDESIAALMRRFPRGEFHEREVWRNKRKLLSKMVDSLDRIDAALGSMPDAEILSNAVLHLLGASEEGEGLTELLVRYLEFVKSAWHGGGTTISTSEAIDGIGALLYGHQQRLGSRVQEVDEATAKLRHARYKMKQIEGRTTHTDPEQ